jgi:branched-chain amino acid aminotransferase
MTVVHFQPIIHWILENGQKYVIIHSTKGKRISKVGGNYAPVSQWTEKASKAGYGFTLHLDGKTRNKMNKFSIASLITIKKTGDPYTVIIPDSKNIIKSIKADSVVDILQSFC